MPRGGLEVRRRYGSVSGTGVGYQIRHPGGATVLVRAYRQDVPLALQFRGSGTASVADWLPGRAATLVWLAACRYPAPRVVRTRTGDTVGVAGPWLTWATSGITGPSRPPGGGEPGVLSLLGLLGAALGRLHALDATTAPAGLGLASWHPAAAIPGALARLRAVEPLLPGEWRPLHSGFAHTLHAVQRAAPRLPLAVVHGDPWPGSLVRTAGGQAALTGWEHAGLGLPIVDLGYCLLECHAGPGGRGAGHLGPGPPGLPVRPGPPGSPGTPGRPGGAGRIQPDEARIAAVLAGYSRWRQLQAAEREILPEAIRFAASYVGAMHFEQALIGGACGAAMDARLGRLRDRLAVSQAVAGLAARHLGPPDAPEPVR
jgi:aminoglycoside phosphotransferase (APT) family kinase protein